MSASPTLHTGGTILDLMQLVNDRYGCQGVYQEGLEPDNMVEAPCGSLARAFCHTCEEAFCANHADDHRKFGCAVTYFQKAVKR